MTPDLFEDAWTRLGLARRAATRISGLWNDYIAGHPYDFRLDDQGDGVHVLRVEQTADLPTGLGLAVGEWANHLRAALDYTIRATAAYTSGRLSDPDAGLVGYPVCDSEEAWTRGLPQLEILGEHHRQMLLTMQPFKSDLDANYLGWINRIALRDRHDGLIRVTGYITELDPALRTSRGCDATMQLGERLIVDGCADVARFVVTPWGEEITVAVNPRIGIDPEVEMWAASSFWRRIPFPERLPTIQAFVAAEIAAYEYDCVGASRNSTSLTQTYRDECDARRDPASEPVLQARPAVEWTDPLSRRSASPEQLAGDDFPPHGPGPRHARPALGPAEPNDDLEQGGTLLVVDTESGALVRHIPDASPLAADVRRGRAAENAIHDAAAMWGLPDFVFRPVVKQLTSGTREVGDGTVLVGTTGLAIQSKAREGVPRGDEKEARWLTKNIGVALSQASGTIRVLMRDPTELANSRGRTIAVDGAQYDWLTVVIIDHPNPPAGFQPALDAAKHPAVVLLRRDWEFLFEQLKSTHGVATYLRRVAGEAVALGEEPARYYELALADDEATSEVLDDRFDLPGATHVSTPLLPLEQHGDEREPAQLVFRAILEDIAVAGRSDGPEQSRLVLLSELDRFPVTQRAEIGQFLLDALADVKDVGSGIAWRVRRAMFGEGGAHLGFGVCSAVHSEQIQSAWRMWVELRHHERQLKTNEGDRLTTVGVLLTPGTMGRPVDTTAISVRGELQFTEQELADYQEIWPSSSPSSQAT